MSDTIRVTVWNEFVHEKENEAVKKLYPDGMHKVIGAALGKQSDIECSYATLDMPEHGLTDEVLAKTDVLIWWGHRAHHLVENDIVTRVQERVLKGMGLIVLHSGHMSKIFRRLMGTSGGLKWREVGERERIWNCAPGHPITQGIGDSMELPNTEMYGEPFGVPQPDQQIFISWFEGGEVFRSGCVWERGAGRIFYFRPGHETYPIFYNDEVMTVITNAVRWANPCTIWEDAMKCYNIKNPPEEIEEKDIDFGSVH